MRAALSCSGAASCTLEQFEGITESATITQ